MADSLGNCVFPNPPAGEEREKALGFSRRGIK